MFVQSLWSGVRMMHQCYLQNSVLSSLKTTEDLLISIIGITLENSLCLIHVLGILVQIQCHVLSKIVSLQHQKHTSYAMTKCLLIFTLC